MSSDTLYLDALRESLREDPSAFRSTFATARYEQRAGALRIEVTRHDAPPQQVSCLDWMAPVPHHNDEEAP